MQKKIIALAIAAAFSAPAFADVTVYGQIHASIDANSGNAPEVAPATGTKNGLNVTTNSSRLGFKGAEDVGGGLKSVFQFEVEVLAGATTPFNKERDTYAGLAGGFGTLIGGRLPLANQYANDANFFGAKVGDAANLTAGGFGGMGLLAVPSRVDRAIAYVSPSLGGVTILAAYVPNTAQSMGLAQNAYGKAASYTLRGSYDSNGIFVAANLVNVAGISATTTAVKDAKVTITSLAGGYDFGMAKVRAQMVQSKADKNAVGAAEAKQTVLALGGAIKVSEDGTVNLQYAKAGKANVGGTDSAGSDATLMAVGYDQALSKATTVYVAYAKVSNGDTAQFSATGYAHTGVGAPGSDAGKSCSPSALSVGMIRNF